MDRLKRNYADILIQAVIFSGLFYIFKTMLNSIYIFEWLTHSNNIWIYIAISIFAFVLTFFDKKYMGYGITFGHLFGSFVGYLAGTIGQKINMAKIVESMDEQTKYQLSYNQGVFIWILCIIFGLLVGVLIQFIKYRKK